MTNVMDPDLLDLMPHTVTVEPWLSADAYGVPVYGAAVTRKALVQAAPKVIRNRDGTEDVSSATVYLGGSFGTSPNDRITLPDGSHPPVLRIDRHANEGGAYAEVIYL